MHPKTVGGQNLLNPGYFTEEDLADAGFAALGTNVRIARTCIIPTPGRVSIGSHVRIDGFTIVTGSLVLGSWIHIGAHCTLIGGAGITFENFTTISHGVRIFTASDDYSGEWMTNPMVPSEVTGVTHGPVRLCRHVVVGANSVILPNAILGEGAAVGALSMVKASLPPWGIYAGVPARRKRDRSQALVALEKRVS